MSKGTKPRNPTPIVTTISKFQDAVGDINSPHGKMRRTIILSFVILFFVVVLVYVAKLLISSLSGSPSLPTAEDLALALLSAPLVIYIFSALFIGQIASARLAQSQMEEAFLEAEKSAKEAEAANKAKSAFLANMSHEIRTPLNAVLGMAQVLETRPMDPSSKEMVQLITTSGRALLTVLNDILDLSKIEAGKLSITPIRANLHLIFEKMHFLFNPQATEKGISLYLNLDKNVPQHVEIDPIRVAQCVSNLVSNAIKFTHEGHISINVSANPLQGDEFEVIIDVKDTGVGLTEEAVERLFVPFEQANESTATQYGGTGLGLAISRDLAERMGGGINVKSETGKGSTFSLILKTKLSKDNLDSASKKVKSPELSSIDGAKILVADDIPINRQILSLFLEPHGAQLTEAKDGKEVLKLLEKNQFDLILMDVHMPEMNGIQAVKTIRESGESWATLPVIALTADAMSGERERLLAVGMTSYLSKPLDASRLTVEVANQLTQANQPSN